MNCYALITFLWFSGNHQQNLPRIQEERSVSTKKKIFFIFYLSGDSICPASIVLQKGILGINDKRLSKKSEVVWDQSIYLYPAKAGSQNYEVLCYLESWLSRCFFLSFGFCFEAEVCVWGGELECVHKHKALKLSHDKEQVLLLSRNRSNRRKRKFSWFSKKILP